MIEARSGFTATRLADGRVLIAGGVVPGDGEGVPVELASAELYDPSTGRWSTTGSMAVSRVGHAAALLSDGTVLVAGGIDMKGAEQAGVEIMGRTSAEIYDPGTGDWTATASMATARGGHSATTLRDGTVLVVGGAYNGDDSPMAERYEPTSGRWVATVSIDEPRRGHGAVLLGDGSVLVVGGVGLGSDPIRLDSAETYDPIRERWSPVAGPVVGAFGQSAILLADGKVLATGGSLDRTVSFALYDPDSGRWSTITTMPEPRVGFTMTLLADGTVLAAGGGFRHADDGVCCVPSGAADTYDPANGAWTATASMSEARHSHQAMLLADGTVLVMGGAGETGDLTSAEIFTPANTAG